MKKQGLKLCNCTAVCRGSDGLANGWRCALTPNQQAPTILDAVVDRVLAYRPKPKSAPARKRQRKQRKFRNNEKGEHDEDEKSVSN
jgi:hypothetical protein